MAKTFLESINVKDPNFLKEYSGRNIYDSSSGKHYSVVNNVLTEVPAIDYKGAPSSEDFFSASGGLAPAGKDSYANTEAWRYANVAGTPQNAYLGQGSTGSPEVIANNGQPIKSGFDITPGQASQAQINNPANYVTAPSATPVKIGGALNSDPTFNIAGMKTEGTTPYYGTLQDLANGGLQVSGGKVYENGQVIGTYGGESPSGKITPSKDYVAPTIQTAPMIAGQTKKTGTDLILPNGQKISADDPNNAQYAKQMGVMRKLGPTEFNALNQQWGQAGLTTQETQDNFLKKIGNDWYLKTDAPSAEQVIANRKAKDAQDKANSGGAGAGAGTNIDGTPKPTPGQSVDDILTAFNASVADEKAAASLAGQAALNIKAELDAMKSKMDLNNILETNQIAAVKQAFNAEKGTIESNPEIDMTFLNRKLGDMVTKMNEGLQNMDIANSVKEAENVYKYNTKLIEYNLAQGKAELAQKQTKDAADEFWKFQGLRLDLLQRQDAIDARTADDLRADAANENSMAKEGYVFISPANKDALTLKYGTDRIYTNPVNGKSYLKPEPEGKHSAIYTEWLDYQKTGGKLSFDAYMTMDANRKRSVTNITMPKTTYNGANIPAKIKTDLLADINVNKRPIEEVMGAYPEVDTAYIQSLYPKKTTNLFE